MKNKSNSGLWCVRTLVMSMQLTACAASQLANGASVETSTPVAADCAQVTEIPQVECAALVALYKSTNGVNWIHNTNWLKTATPCDWVGVQCSDDHVTGLDIGSNHLAGSIPPEIGNLSNLTYLDLSDNQLTGLPPEIEKLSELRYLYLSGNQLTNLPPEIGTLSNLTDLRLDGNQLTVLPSEIGDLSHLNILNLSYNPLTALPPEIGDLSRLTFLDLADNRLAILPSEIGNLSNLIYLFLSRNQLTFLPPEIGNLSNLVELHLDDNPFTSPVPPSITKLDKLRYLDLSPCSGLTSSDPQVIAFLDAKAPGWNQCP